LLYFIYGIIPEQRLVYLEKSKDWIGFSDYNLKHYGCHLRYLPQNIKWIKRFYSRIDYASSNYEAITRQNALEKLIGFKLINDAVLKLG
jgi:aminopeptidase N